jgi:hypothetical protein
LRFLLAFLPQAVACNRKRGVKWLRYAWDLKKCKQDLYKFVSSGVKKLEKRGKKQALPDSCVEMQRWACRNG